MLPSTWKKMQNEKLKAQKTKVHKKISNNFIESAVKNNTVSALKTIYYIATGLEQLNLEQYKDDELLAITLDTKNMLQYTEMTMIEITRNLKAMQKTSITFKDEIEQWEMGISLLPYYKNHYGKNKTEVKLFAKIARLIIDVKSNYTMINTKALMQLKSKHSLRLLPLLYRISNYHKNIDVQKDDGSYTKVDVMPKRKTYDLDELNEIFGTTYKRFIDIENKILKPVKTELDLNSKISFIYEMEFDLLGAGRPKATGITIDVIDNSSSLFSS